MAQRRWLLLAAGLAATGPCVWLAWNLYAHGSALHFVARVTAFYDAHAPMASFGERLLAYPRALVLAAPELCAVGALGSWGLDGVRARWRRPLITTFVLFAFLVYGECMGGAPAHHPERALLAPWWVLAGFGIDGAAVLVRRYAWARPKREAWIVALSVVAAGAVVGERLGRTRVLDAKGLGHAVPGSSPDEDRSAQVARGLALRAEGVTPLAVVPCAYEHFALIAAFGEPERVTVLESTGPPVTPACPEVRLPIP